MRNRDFSVESTSINKKRVDKYKPMMDWWAAQRKGAAKSPQDEERDANSWWPKMNDMSVAAAQEYIMTRKIDAMMPAATELDKLTQEFEQLETKWKVYLGLSVANELGEHQLFEGKGIRRTKQAKALRQDIRGELRNSLQGMLHAVIQTKDSEDEENLAEIDRLLLELEAVEVQTDEYVQRLELNLQAIRQGEEAQVDTMLMQQEMQKEVLGRIDSVNAGLTANLSRMKDLTGNSLAVFRLVGVVAFGLAVVFGAFVFKKMAA